MELKKVLVVHKDSILEEHRKTMYGVRKILNGYDIKSSFLGRNELNKKCEEGCDLILSVGGDGTLLRVSHFVNNAAILGINSNPKTSEGVLCYATRHDLKEKLARSNLTEGKLSANQKICIKSKMTNGIVAVDSTVEIPFSNEEKIEVGISPESLMLISFV